MKRKKKFLAMIFLGAVMALSACQGEKEKILIGQAEVLSQESDAENADEQEGSEASSGKKGEKTADTENSEKILPTVWVDVSGAVKSPGVYELAADSRVFQAIEAAGGFTEEADAQWLNQAEPVSDGEKILVYTREETQELKEQGVSVSQINQETTEAETGTQGKININQASLEELQEIPGIGEVRAQAIIDYREEAGGFGSIEDIQQVSGIKGKTFEKIEAYITVE